jgi:hypothetical protein
MNDKKPCKSNRPKERANILGRTELFDYHLFFYISNPRSMRVRVSLDFDILIESFISLCIIETKGW